MNGLDLFSGIGGLGFAMAPWVRTVAYCENDKYAQSVLLSRMRTGDIDCAPIWDDVRTLRGESLRGTIDIVYGGFPCQDISVAGNGRGLAGERSGLYSHLERLVAETKPTFVFLENVPAIRTRGLGRVVWGLASLGYDFRWTVVSAAGVGAPHKRDRWFLLAADPDRINKRNQSRRIGGTSWTSKAITRNDGAQESLADAKSFRWSERWAKSARLKGRFESAGGGSSMANTNSETCIDGRSPKPGTSQRTRAIDMFAGPSWWATEPDVGRVVNGLPHRVDRIRGLGNSVVPLQAREAFKRLAGIGGLNA